MPPPRHILDGRVRVGRNLLELAFDEPLNACAAEVDLPPGPGGGKQGRGNRQNDGRAKVLPDRRKRPCHRFFEGEHLHASRHRMSRSNWLCASDDGPWISASPFGSGVLTG